MLTKQGSITMDVVGQYLNGEYEQLHKAGLITYCRYLVIRSVFLLEWKNKLPRDAGGNALQLQIDGNELIGNIESWDEFDLIFLARLVCRHTLKARRGLDRISVVGRSIHMKAGFQYTDPTSNEPTTNSSEREIVIKIEDIHKMISAMEIDKDFGKWIRVLSVLYKTDSDRTGDEKALLKDPYLCRQPKRGKREKNTGEPLTI